MFSAPLVIGVPACACLPTTGDLELIASRCSQLTCLGLSLPVGIGTQLVDLRALVPLTNMRQVGYKTVKGQARDG